jgi:pre-mRNA-splicing factor ATP-dependent RNA helicase DHX15/PRP43
MERFDLDLVSTSFDDKKYYTQIRQVIAASFFMQVAHREGEKNSYLTLKDNQVVSLHPSCGLDNNPEWVIYHEFVLTTRNYIRTVTEVRPEWLLDFAPSYFDLGPTFPEGSAKRELQRIVNRKTLKNGVGERGGDDGQVKKKRKKDRK